MSNNPTTPDGAALSAGHALPQFEDIDPCPLDDITPYESDMTTSRPCAYCGLTDCSCDDSPFDHITNRLGW